MTLQNLYFITEIIGGIAIIGSLIFVALQVRQNTAAMHAAALERHADYYKMLNAPVVESGEFAEIWLRGLKDFDSLTDVERVRFFAELTMAMRGWETMFLLHERGAVDERLWAASTESTRAAFKNAGFQAYWRMRRYTFCEPFQDYIDRLIAEGGDHALYDDLDSRKS